jgi:GT2 family glycosyltransferase
MTVRREALLRAGGFDESLSGYEDDDLFLRLWLGGRVDYLPVSTLKWRIYRDSYSQSERMVQSRLRYCRKLLANHTDGGRDLGRVRGIARRFVTEFWCQAAFQMRDENPLYRRNFDVGTEVLSHLSAPRRLFYGGLVARWFRLAERSRPARRVLVAWLSHVYSGRR